MILVFLWLIGSCSTFTVHGACPPASGIYLMHMHDSDDYCLPEYTAISDIALTAKNPLRCVLAGTIDSSGSGGGGLWTGPNNTIVQCDESGSGPFASCSQSSDLTSITLYKKTGASFSGKQLYTCTISGQSTSVQIKSNSVLSAVYVKPPDNIGIPQVFKIYCIMATETYEIANSITVRLIHNQNHTEELDEQNICSNSLQENHYKCTYSKSIHWFGLDGTEFSAAQGLAEYNGDNDWACGVTYSSNGTSYDEQLQTYIRVPSFTPTNLTVLHKNATSVTISWTAVDATDADGYAVYYGGYAADVGNASEYTITKHILPGTMYTISIRAYQDLIGAESDKLSVETRQIVLGPLSGTLVSPHTSLEVIYCCECITQYAASEHIRWTVNGTSIINSTVYSNISNQPVNMTTEIWKSTLTVMGKEHNSQNISCGVIHAYGFKDYIWLLIKAPSGPPVDVAVSINTSSSIAVSWSPPVGGADGYVIIYSTEGSSNMTQLVEGGNQTSSLLTGLSEGHLYTIRMFAYDDLPSLLSNPVEVILDVPDPVSDLKVMSISPDNASVSWNSSHNQPVWFTVDYHSITCQDNSTNYQLNVTTLSCTITNLQIGQEYNVSVIVSNIIGASSATSLIYRVPSAVPDGPPQSVTVSSVSFYSIKVSWGDVLCDQRNGEITGYQVNYTSISDYEIVTVTGNKTNVTLSDLQPYTNYSISVAAMTVSGIGPFSTPVTIKTLFTVLDPVEHIEFDNASSTSLFVSWSPSLDTEHIVDNYIVLYSTTCEGQVNTGNYTVTNTCVTIDHLEEGMNYTIIIIAANKMGKGEPAYSYAVTEEATPTGTPTITTAVAINEKTAFVSWKQVDCFMQNGFITHYNVTIVRSGSIIYSNNTLSNEKEATLTETFQSNMSYTVSIAAVNSAGTGPPTSSLIQISAPGPVGALVAIMGQTNATLQWTEPTFNTHNGELYYEVLYVKLSATIEYSSQLQMAVNINTSNNFLHIKNLLPKTLYKFSVRAVSNISGPGKETTVCNTTLPDESVTTPFVPTTVIEQASFQTPTTTNILGTAGTLEVNLLIAAGVGGGAFVIIGTMAVIIVSVIITMSSRRLSKKSPVKNETEMFFDQPDVYERIAPRPQPVIIEETDVSKDGADSIIDIQAGDLESAASLAHLYAALDTPAPIVQEEEKQRETETEFYQGIVTTHPIPVSELTTHVTSMHSDNKATFVEQYKNVYNGEDKACTVAFSAKWRELNRFKNIAPYDDNLITLKPIENCSVRPQEFINASFIDGYCSKNKYIAAQGPLKKTLSDFWWLIWQERAMCVVMVTNTVENGKAKCEQYWPTTQQEPVAYGPFTISLLDEQQLPNFVIRNLKVLLTDYPQSGMTVTQYHFTTWPDHGVPETSNPLIKLHKMVVDCWRMVGGPILVHCSAGVGRTGTFITIDLALEQAEKEGVVDIAGIVNRLREQRMKMVQTEVFRKF